VVRAVTIQIARNPEYEREYCQVTFNGWYVEGTNDAFAVDERYPAEPEFGEDAIFAITHLPSGRRLRHGALTRASTLEQAVRIAQGFYREAIAIGMDLSSSSFEAISAGYTALTPDEKTKFWVRVLTIRSQS
jgi:hypothetical protein